MAEDRPVVYVVHPPGYIGITPTIHSILSYLIGHGDDVRMISLEEPVGAPSELTTEALGVRHPGLRQRYVRPLRHLWMPFFVWRRVRAHRRRVVIAIDTDGVVASAVTILAGTAPHIYVSLHIEYFAELRRKRSYIALAKRLVEQCLLRHVTALITQDRYRHNELRKQNSLRKSTRIFMVPNSYRGQASRTESRYYHDLLKLVSDEPIVLVAGCVARWAHVEFLARCAGQQRKPPYYTLVIQSRDEIPEPIPQWISDLAGERVILSLKPLPIGDLMVAFGSAAVGAAIYTNDIYQNQAFVGGTSGKMLAYLKSGLPVIMMEGLGVSEVINSFRCGRLLDRLDIDKFNDMVQDVIANRSEYSANALRCYDELYDFDRQFDKVHAFMMEGFGPTADGTQVAGHYQDK